jgi:non-specific serine/threonine protein kinase
MSRHNTLLGVLAWSYEHLAPDEQVWLQRLAVFAGGWTLDAATAVAGHGCTELDSLQRLERLVDMSLVAVDPLAPVGPRYSMLETVRQFAQERLDQSGGTDAVRERHLAYFLALAKRAHLQLFTRSANPWYQRLDCELSNLLAAHAWCTRAPEGRDPGLELAINLRLYWINRGHFALGERVYDEALARDETDPRSIHRGRALFALGQHRNFCGQFAQAIAPLRESLSITREAGDHESAANCLDKLAFAYAFLGDGARALAYSEEELEMSRRTGQEISSALNTRGAIFRMLGDYGAAADALEEALRHCNRENVDHIHTILSEIARTALARGALDKAQETLAESICLLADLDSRYRSALALDATSLLASARGDWQRAARLQCVCEGTLSKMGDFRNPYDDPALAELRRRPRAMLDAEAFAAAYETGRGYSLEQALAESLAWLQQDSRHGTGEHLAPRVANGPGRGPG